MFSRFAGLFVHGRGKVSRFLNQEATAGITAALGGATGVVLGAIYASMASAESLTVLLVVVLLMQLVGLLILNREPDLKTARLALFSLANALAITITLAQFYALWAGIEAWMLLMLGVSFPVMVVLLALVVPAARRISQALMR